GAPARTELTRISGPAVGAPPRCEPPHPFAPGTGAPTRTALTRRTGSAVGAPPRCEAPAPFAPGPGALRPASAHSKVHADPLPVDLVHADIHLVEIAQHLVTDDLLRGSLIHGPTP